jgi:hypothetical protein
MTDPITDQLPEPAPDAPGDGTTLVEVLAGYEAAGFGAQMAATESGSVKCFACGQESAPSGFLMHSLRRLEGASDPDDMLAVAAVSCPHCCCRGVLVLNYGPETTEASEVLLRFIDARDDGVLPPAQTPSEAAAARSDESSG